MTLLISVAPSFPLKWQKASGYLRAVFSVTLTLGGLRRPHNQKLCVGPNSPLSNKYSGDAGHRSKVRELCLLLSCTGPLTLEVTFSSSCLIWEIVHNSVFS